MAESGSRSRSRGYQGGVRQRLWLGASRARSRPAPHEQDVMPAAASSSSSRCIPGLHKPPATMSSSSSRLLPDLQKQRAKGFANYLENLLLENSVSAKVVQEISSLASAEGVANVSQLAKAGASGKHMGNLKRDILRTLLKKKHSFRTVLGRNTNSWPQGGGCYQHVAIPTTT